MSQSYDVRWREWLLHVPDRISRLEIGEENNYSMGELLASLTKPGARLSCLSARQFSFVFAHFIALANVNKIMLFVFSMWQMSRDTAQQFKWSAHKVRCTFLTAGCIEGIDRWYYDQISDLARTSLQVLGALHTIEGFRNISKKPCLEAGGSFSSIPGTHDIWKIGLDMIWIG